MKDKNNIQYDNLLKNSSVTSFSYPSIFIPSPTDRDYSKGYIVRYFCKKVGDENTNIIEVDKSTFDKISQVRTTLFMGVGFDWKISGNRHNIIKNGIVESIGVEDFNLKKLITVNEKFNGIKSLLQNNLTQFWKGY